MLRKLIKLAVFALVAAFVLIQFVPVARSNPPVLSTVTAPEPVMDILRRSCFDCHSNETVWPWYGKIAPMSWLVARDVKEGREAMNFSEWNRYSASEQAHHIEEAVEEATEGNMPMKIYVLLHPSARLSKADLRALSAWVRPNEDD